MHRRDDDELKTPDHYCRKLKSGSSTTNKPCCVVEWLIDQAKPGLPFIAGQVMVSGKPWCSPMREQKGFTGLDSPVARHSFPPSSEYCTARCGSRIIFCGLDSNWQACVRAPSRKRGSVFSLKLFQGRKAGEAQPAVTSLCTP
jgi:hypothetical protein